MLCIAIHALTRKIRIGISFLGAYISFAQLRMCKDIASRAVVVGLVERGASYIIYSSLYTYVYIYIYFYIYIYVYRFLCTPSLFPIHTYIFLSGALQGAQKVKRMSGEFVGFRAR